MYGMVNRAIEDLVVSSAGEDAWVQIKKDAGIDIPMFQDSTEYNDAITFKLVQAASEFLKQTPEAILHAFGRHWVLYTGREGWASIFNLGGENMVEFINGLDSMHARVQIALPNAEMPQFRVTEKEDHLELIYRSQRTGFAPMVLGLLDGLAEQFNEKWDIEHVQFQHDVGHDIFHLRKAVSAAPDVDSYAA